jgi:hypothetical protein
MLLRNGAAAISFLPIAPKALPMTESARRTGKRK